MSFPKPIQVVGSAARAVGSFARESPVTFGLLTSGVGVAGLTFVGVATGVVSEPVGLAGITLAGILAVGGAIAGIRYPVV